MKFNSEMPRLGSKRILSKTLGILLTFCLVLSNFPILNNVSAEEPQPELIQMPNMVVNSGFESDLASWTKVIQTATISIDDTVAYEGSKSLKITNTTASTRGCIDQQYFTLDPGATYV
ncbi:MAG TPA: carbohydrate binding domain-containing protein, partial [Clostridiales bacterium]|nr:carbohydrate binding domain-containing protein [Clostridiales bacterium]